MEEATQSAKSFWYSTSKHGLKFLQVFTKKEKIILSATVIGTFAMLAMASYFTSLVILAAIFFLVSLLDFSISSTASRKTYFIGLSERWWVVDAISLMERPDQNSSSNCLLIFFRDLKSRIL